MSEKNIEKYLRSTDRKITATLSLPVSPEFKSRVDQAKLKVDINRWARELLMSRFYEIERLCASSNLGDDVEVASER